MVQNDFLYAVDTTLIVAVLFATMLLTMEGGFRVGRSRRGRMGKEAREHVTIIQGAALGLLALVLGFSFTLALGRFDSRSEAVVREANAFGTAYLRTDFLSPTVRADVQELLREFVDLRVELNRLTVREVDRYRTLNGQANARISEAWRFTAVAVEEGRNPVATGLFIQSLNDLIDSVGVRDAALQRHIPEAVLFLLYGTFLMTGLILGYAAGVDGERPSFAAYVMVTLIAVLVFIIVDVDRPRRGLIQVSNQPIVDVQTQVKQGLGPRPR